VRELNNVIERTLATCKEERVTAADLPFYLHDTLKSVSSSPYSLLKEVVAKAEKLAIEDALKMTEYNKARAAEMLGIHRTLLYKKISKYGISLTPD
jgi:transcriptional regulator with PAS, ATPase and Fis domain